MSIMSDAATVTWEKALRGIVQGVPEAMQVMDKLRETCPAEYPRLVLYLYDRGPRGPRLWERFEGQYGCDALMFGKDLITLASEFTGWNDND